MKRAFLITLAALIAAFAFSGCIRILSPEDMVAKYVELNRSSLDEVAESVKDTMKVTCFAEGKSIVIQYDYLLDNANDPESTRKALDSVGTTYKAMYDELAAFVKDEDVSIVLRFNQKDGSRILEYIVDKNYVPAENSSEFDFDNIKTVEDYICSDAFKAILSARDDESFTYSADVENGSTVVVFHKLRYAYSEEELDEIKEAWYASMTETGPEAALNMKNTVGMAVKGAEIDVAFRLLDCEGNVLSEYPGK